MGQTQYLRGQPTSLQDLMNQAALQPDAPVEVPSPPQASQVMTEGMTTPQERQKLLDILFAPDDPGPVPEVDKPSALAMLFSGLGDATNAFAANAYGGKTSSYFDQYLNKQNQQKADLQKYQEKVAQGRTQAKQRTAQYFLSESDRKQMRADEIAGRKAVVDAQIADRELARKQQQDQFEFAKAQQKQDAIDKADLAVKLARMEGGFHESVARINGNVDKTQARMDKKDLGDAITFIGKTALSAKAMLAGGDGQPPMTPEQIMKTVDITLDGLTLTPEARKAADAYAAKELGVILHNHSIEQMNTEMAGNGPQQDTSFNLTKWMREHGY